MNGHHVWGIHGGMTGDAYSLFVQRNVVALGWSAMGDLSAIPADRESFKQTATRQYPDKKPGAIINTAGQLFRFLYELQVEHYIVFPSKHDRMIHIGQIEGTYEYRPDWSEGYPNLRSVRWLKILSRDSFSQGALYEIGSALSFFQVKNYAEEFLAALENNQVPLPISRDETVQIVSAEIEETTKDFILKTLSQELKGHPLTDFVAQLLATMGYRTRVSPEGPDGGVDIIAHRDELGFEPPIIKVQVKSSDGKIGDDVVSALYGKVGPNEHGLFVTIGSFTAAAERFAKSKSNLRLVDGEEFVQMVLAHYEQFDSRYKGILPLKRVYIPEPIDDIEEE